MDTVDANTWWTIAAILAAALISAIVAVWTRRDRAKTWPSDEIRALLRRAEKISDLVRDEGSFSAARFAELETQTLTVDVEQLARRGAPVKVRTLLHELAVAIRALADEAIPEEMTAPAEQHRIHRMAVQQDRRAQELDALIARIWEDLWPEESS